MWMGCILYPKFKYFIQLSILMNKLSIKIKEIMKAFGKSLGGNVMGLAVNGAIVPCMFIFDN